ncbi:MAG: 4Fe-4S binding protein [Spirochaetales bacterium]|nr:4Fe-4S binding protein [Spirochaetales bacterium]
MDNNIRHTWLDTLEHLPEALHCDFITRLAASCGITFPGGASVKREMDGYFNSLLRNDTNKPIVYIGMGTCGLAAGAGDTYSAVKEYIESKHIAADVIPVGCIGLCCAEPLMDVQLPGKTRVSFRNAIGKKAAALLASMLDDGKVPRADVLGQFSHTQSMLWEDIPLLAEHPFFSPQKRVVLSNCGIINPLSISEYIARGGYAALLKAIHKNTPDDICSIMTASGLRGRGGGGFPTGKKWRAALDRNSPVKYFVCNADEGDPGAFMDRALCESDPHRLLEGLAVGAYATGAQTAYIYIRAEYPLAIRHLTKAIGEMRAFGFLGDNIWDSGFNLDIVIKKGAGAFVCGEETSLINSIEGKRGMPRPRPPYPPEKGLHERPTVINNVETLANISSIVVMGADWFTSFGTKESPGTKVFALSGKVVRTGLVEVSIGTSMRDIVYAIGGGIPDNKRCKAVQIGGPSGGCVPEHLFNIEIDYHTLPEVGAMMGSGGLVVMDEDNCMVDVARFFMDFITRESCGKCIPCREGTKRILSILNSIIRPRKSEQDTDALSRFRDVLDLVPLAGVIKATSLCGLGQSAPNPVLSTIRWFREEYEAHVFERTCPAGVCTDLLTYSIDPDTCIGCTACLVKCPENAIMGRKGTPHYIVPDKCSGCGTCRDICRKGAVVVR